MGTVTKKSTKFNTTLMVAVAAVILSAITVYLYSQIFSRATILVPRKDKEKITAFSTVKETDFEKTYISKLDMKYFSDVVVDYSEIAGKVPTGELQAGLPVKKSQFVNLSNSKDLASTITTVDGRDTLLFLKKPYALNGGFQPGSEVDLYMITEVGGENGEKKETYILPIKNLLKIKNKIEADGGYYILVETEDITSEQYVLMHYLAVKGTATFAITLPGINPTDYKGKVYKLSDFMQKALTDGASNANNTNKVQ